MCVVCGKPVVRTGSRGPIPKYCSQRCGTKARRTPRRKEYERLYAAMKRRTSTKRAAYEWSYNRRPEVKERNRERMRLKWHTDPEYRERQLARWNPFRDVDLPAPYTGHRWLDMAREAVTKEHIDPLFPSSDDYYDDMGEALLALLEGRDPREAVKEHRSREYPSRRLFIRMGDWGDDEDEQVKFFEKVMPTVESAEDEAMARVVIETRFSNVSTKNRRMKHKTQQPRRRRMKDGKNWQRHLARSA